MVNLKDKAHNAVVVVKGNCGRVSKKVLAAVCSASLAMSAMAVNAFAEGETSSVSGMYNTIGDSFKSGMVDLVAGIGVIAAAVIPIGVGIIGLTAAIGFAKRIFTKLVG